MGEVRDRGHRYKPGGGWEVSAGGAVAGMAGFFGRGPGGSASSRRSMIEERSG